MLLCPVGSQIASVDGKSDVQLHWIIKHFSGYNIWCFRDAGQCRTLDRHLFCSKLVLRGTDINPYGVYKSAAMAANTRRIRLPA
jgi:hypothetical protein